MAVYFALALILDLILLKGKSRIFALIMTLAVAVICYISTLFWGWDVLPEGGLNSMQLFIDMMQSIIIVGFLVGVIILYQTRLYRNEKSKAEAAISASEAAISASEAAQVTTSAMFGSNPQINILFNDSFKLIDCNPAAVEFFGFRTKEDLLSGFLERITKSIPAFQPDGRPSVPLADRLITTVKDGSVKFETELHLASGEVRNLSVEFRKIPYADSFAIVGYVFDMTEIHKREMELKQRDQQLSEAVEEARMANLAKSNFLATMSHEIRTPMNAILGITEIQLQKEMLGEDVLEAFSKIYTSGDMLLGIINDILDLSRIEAGKLELAVDKYEIASLISDTAQLNMMRIGSKPIEFELNVDENMPAVFLGDELRVKQILNNILSNAFKYTAEGTVTLSVFAESVDCSNGSATLVFSISDTGQGMTEEQVGKLFEKYARFNMEANRSTEGTGLGMSITQNLIHLMDGEMIIESEPGVGSTFTVRLPQDQDCSGVLGKEVAENLHNFRTSSRAQMRRVQITREPMPYGRVLIVDDVETNIFVAKGLLTPYKLKIDSSDSGYAAIEKVKNGNVYDIVFMDHMMPKMDGIEATKIIRSMGYDQPIVALTANAVSGQADIFLGNGFDDFISKPIDIRQLNTVLHKFVRDKQSPEVIAAAKKQAEEDPAKTSGNVPHRTLDPRFAEIFARDAFKALATLEAISARNDYGNEDDMRSYIINMHGMKSALANIGKMDLSAVALKLETAGREGKLDLVAAETSGFISSLRTFTEELIPRKEPVDSDNTDENKPFLREKLLTIKAACGEYDEDTADETLSELMEAAWSQKTKELLTTIAELLLHSDFDEIVDIISRFIELE